MGAGPQLNAIEQLGHEGHPRAAALPGSRRQRSDRFSDFLVGHTDLQPDLLEQGNVLACASVFMLLVLICYRAQDVGAGQVLKARGLERLLDIGQMRVDT